MLVGPDGEVDGDVTAEVDGAVSGESVEIYTDAEIDDDDGSGDDSDDDDDD